MTSAAPSLRAVMPASTASDMPCLLAAKSARIQRVSRAATDTVIAARRTTVTRSRDGCPAPWRHVRVGYKLGSDESALRGPSAFFRSAQGLIVAMDPLMPWSPLPVTEPLEHCLQLVQVESLSAPFEV